MANTPMLNLPLLSPSQAQKHVTVNEALSYLDLITHLTVQAGDLTAPPTSPSDGDAYLLPIGGEDAWAGEDGKIAVFFNGGWRFSTPRVGWRAWSLAKGSYLTFDGTGWVHAENAVSAGGAGLASRVIETDHVITAGASSLSAAIIPSHASVIGVTARVIGPITGSLTSWRVGVVGADDRYGSGLGLDLNSYAKGLSGSPLTYWGDTELLLTAEGGAFTAGQVRLAVHCSELVPPREV